MKSAEEIAYGLLPIPAQSKWSWMREDAINVLRPLLAVLKRAVYEQRYGCTAKCRICGRKWWAADEPAHADDCPVPAALEVLKP